MCRTRPPLSICRVGSGICQHAGGSEVGEEKRVGGNVGNYTVERLGRVRESAGGGEVLGGWGKGEEGSGTCTPMRRRGCRDGEERVLVEVMMPPPPEEGHGSVGWFKC